MPDSSEHLESTEEPVPIQTTTMQGSPLSQTGSVSYVGLQLGKYRVESRLGGGNMGDVWKAWDTVGDRHVVVKTVPPEVGRDVGSMDEIKSNFQQVFKLQHQNICPVYDLGFDEQCGYFLVMKFIEGQTLKEYRQSASQSGTFSPRRVVELLKPVAAALDYSHSQKVIHRDIKPDNIMVTPDGDVQVVDFGISAQIRESYTRISQQKMDCQGTPRYMAPEQWKADYQDGKTDQYALAVVAYELLAGRVPFNAPNIQALAYCTLNEPVPPIEDLDPRVDDVLCRGLSKDRTGRFESCAAFINTLKAESLPRRPPQKKWVTTLLLLLAGLASAVLSYWVILSVLG
jgi:eukaryotic-like serine/threonine-protein kinase